MYWESSGFGLGGLYEGWFTNRGKGLGISEWLPTEDCMNVVFGMIVS